MKFILPFPESILRPNDKSHWTKKHPFKKAMRDSGFLAGNARRGQVYWGTGRLAVKIVFFPPMMNWDLDGMHSAIKAGLDGLAMGLCVNDKQFRPILLDCYCADKVTPRVEITIYQKSTKKDKIVVDTITKL